MGLNGVMMQYFEWDIKSDGSLWRQLKENATKLKETGITAVWMPPAYKGFAGPIDSGYGVYDLYDLGEFVKKETEQYKDTEPRTKYGTKEEYIEAIKACKEAGVQTYADIVLNHMTGAGKTEKVWAVKWKRNSENERWYPTDERLEIDAWTDFQLLGRNKQYSNFKWNKDCFDGVDTDGEAYDKNTIYLFEGKEWDPNTNFDFLNCSDIDAENPVVREQLKKWGKWYLETTKVDGLRLDALKHISPEMYNEWLDYMGGLKDLFIVGEYYDLGYEALNAYFQHITTDKVQMHLFDFALHEKFYLASEQMGYPLKNLMKEDTLMKCRPMSAVTFVDNHDTQVRLDPYNQMQEREVKAWFKSHAYAFILLREQGYPCVFYKDYHGEETMEGTNADKIRKMIRIRRELAYGEQHDYISDLNEIGWTRESTEGTSGVAVLLSKDGSSPLTMYVGECEKGKQYVNVFAPETGVLIGENGTGEFPVSLGEMAVYIEKETYEKLF